MRIKSFYASTVEGAVALARREMGAEAMLVESRKAPLEARHLGEYEVVCALVPEEETAKPQAPEDTGPQDARLAGDCGRSSVRTRHLQSNEEQGTTMSVAVAHSNRVIELNWLRLKIRCSHCFRLNESSQPQSPE